MGTAYIKCPQMGLDLPVETALNPATLLLATNAPDASLPVEEIAACPLCGNPHKWTARDIVGFADR